MSSTQSTFDNKGLETYVIIKIHYFQNILCKPVKSFYIGQGIQEWTR